MSLGMKIVVTGLVAFVLALGAGWFYLGKQSPVLETVAETAALEPEPMAIVEPQVEAVAEAGDEPVAEAETVTQTEVEPAGVEVAAVEVEVTDEQVTGAGDEPVAEAETVTQTEVEPAGVEVAAVEAEVTDEQVTGAEPEVAPETGLEAESVTVLETGNVAGSVDQDTMMAEPGTASDTDAVLVEEVDTSQQETALADVAAVSAQEQAEPESSSLSRFQRELEMSRDWIKGKAESVGTMQILMLSYKTFDEAVYYDYVDSLARKQVDTTQLKVFKTYTGGAEVYSVFYGEYASRKAALKSKNDLPEVLRKISPIPRSVGGILQEIRRLEAES
jgi:hypothetical protein